MLGINSVQSGLWNQEKCSEDVYTYRFGWIYSWLPVLSNQGRCLEKEV